MVRVKRLIIMEFVLRDHNEVIEWNIIVSKKIFLFNVIGMILDRGIKVDPLH
jgi:hypothetical protein